MNLARGSVRPTSGAEQPLEHLAGCEVAPRTLPPTWLCCSGLAARCRALVYSAARSREAGRATTIRCGPAPSGHARRTAPLAGEPPAAVGACNALALSPVADLDGDCRDEVPLRNGSSGDLLRRGRGPTTTAVGRDLGLSSRPGACRHRGKPETRSASCRCGCRRISRRTSALSPKKVTIGRC